MDLGLDLEQLALWAGGLSLLGVIGSLLGIPWVVARLPRNYFNRPRRAPLRESADHPLVALGLAVLKNALGALLVLLGLVMLVTPGQGLLTLLVGLLFMNFPGKYQLERWLLRRPGVFGALNWLRERRGRPPFDPPAY